MCFIIMSHIIVDKKKRIDEQELYLLASILFLQHMTTFTTTTSNFPLQFTINNHWLSLTIAPDC